MTVAATERTREDEQAGQKANGIGFVGARVTSAAPDHESEASDGR
jgi:hypothetical protein